MSCPSPSSLLLLIHPDHMERGLFMFVSAHAQKSIRAYLFAQFFFLTVNSYFEDYLFMYIVYLRIYTYSQLLMTHLGFLYPYIHQPYNLFKKNTKKNHALLFRFGPGVLWCSWNLSKEQRRKPCPKALPGCRHGVCWNGEVLEVTFSMTSISNCKIVGGSTFEPFWFWVGIRCNRSILFDYIYEYAWQIMSI